MNFKEFKKKIKRNFQNKVQNKLDALNKVFEGTLI